MFRRFYRSLWTLYALAAALTLAAFLPREAAERTPATERTPAPAPAHPSALETLLWPIPSTLRLDQSGAVLAPGRLADKLVVVSFITAGCTITCVIRTRDLDALVRSLPGPLRGRVALVAVSLDPVRDDARTLRDFAGSLGLDPAQVSVLGSDPDTAARHRAALRYPADRAEPPDTVLVFDRIGQLAMNYGGAPVDRPRLARDLGELDRFTQGVGHPPSTGAVPTL